jgi:hypothetical protein
MKEPKGEGERRVYQSIKDALCDETEKGKVKQEAHRLTETTASKIIYTKNTWSTQNFKAF